MLRVMGINSVFHREISKIFAQIAQIAKSQASGTLGR
jgi:hypothetical protein